MLKKAVQLYLVRHGDVANPRKIIYGYLPLGLSSLGRRQAKRAGSMLKNKNIEVIFSSPQKRAQETTKIISQVIFKEKKKVLIDKNLRESALGYVSQGFTEKELIKKFPKMWQTYYSRPAAIKAGGENLAKMADRFLLAIRQAIKKYPGKNLVFVSHRDPIVAVLLKLAKRNFNDLHRVKGVCQTGAVCEVRFVGGKLINKTRLPR